MADPAPTTIPVRAMRSADPPGPCAMVLFGAGGDLTHRLVFPALYNLAHSHLLPQNFCLIGADLADLTTEAWTKNLSETLHSFIGSGGEFSVTEIDEEALRWLTQRMVYVKGDLTKPDLYQSIAKHLKQAEADHHTGGNALFYLAVADRFFATVIDNLGTAKLVQEPDESHKTWQRVIIEKPFGHDLESAKALNTHILRVLDESQIFRIDHFLGKETVQNIMAMRFANGMFEPLWNRDHIDHVQITAAETVGVEGRGHFYEQTGALRDMVPNHVFQLLAMTAMEPPVSFAANAIRRAKTDALLAIRPPTEADCVRGQYGPGTVDHVAMRAYRSEPDVAPDSPVETYIALRLMLDNWRWSGVPFYLRTGKHMCRRTTEIAIRFKDAPMALFAETGVHTAGPNWLVIQVQPDEGISIQFDVKRPGPVVELAPVLMDFKYKDWFPPQPNVGYETLLYDVMIGDATLFQLADQVEAGWRAVQPVLDLWAAQKPKDFPNYASGSAGPDAADAMLARDGRTWRSVAPQ
jgi:glucose-6-phosphate 1-dehydrogenase